MEQKTHCFQLEIVDIKYCSFLIRFTSRFHKLIAYIRKFSHSEYRRAQMFLTVFKETFFSESLEIGSSTYSLSTVRTINHGVLQGGTLL